MRETTLDPMPAETVLRVSNPAELIEAIPYLIGTTPADSLVVFGVRPGRRGRVAPVLRLDLPPPERFRAAVRHLVATIARHGSAALGIIVYIDRPVGGDRRGVDRYRPLYEAALDLCAEHRLPLFEALCIERRRWWSYTCTTGCCTSEGRALPAETASVIAATAVSAGLPPPVPQTALLQTVRPPEGLARKAADRAFAHVRRELVHRGEDYGSLIGLRTESLALLHAARVRFRNGDRDVRHDEAARLVLGLTDIQVRDHAMSWDDADHRPLLALWTALARMSPPPESAVPLTLAAWTAWTGEEPAMARVAVNRALDDNPDYTMAQLLHTAINSTLSARESRRALFPERSPRRPRRDPATPNRARSSPHDKPATDTPDDRNGPDHDSPPDTRDPDAHDPDTHDPDTRDPGPHSTDPETETDTDPCGDAHDGSPAGRATAPAETLTSEAPITEAPTSEAQPALDTPGFAGRTPSEEQS